MGDCCQKYVSMSQREVFMTMESGMIQAFYGTGKGKTSAAVGQALRELQHGQRITMIQFLKGKVADDFQVLERLEPDVQIFRFDKSEENYCDLSEREKEEEKANILNGFNFSKKVLETGESDVIILDELLGLIDLVRQAGATLIGAACAIEKGFQGGGDALRAAGVRVESLAIIESMSDTEIIFRR